MSPVSKSKFALKVEVSCLDFSNKLSYSVTKNGLDTNGYSFENTNF